MALALVDDWTKPRSTRASIEEGEHLGLLALQGRGRAKPGSPEQGIDFLGSRAVDGTEDAPALGAPALGESLAVSASRDLVVTTLKKQRAGNKSPTS